MNDGIIISSFATPNELMELGNNHEWLLRSQKRTITKHVLLDRSIQNHLLSILVPKNKPEFDQPSGSKHQFMESSGRNVPNNTTEIQLGKKQTNKKQTTNITGQTTLFRQQKFMRKKGRKE